MKIGIDIRILVRGNRTGVEDYTINLLNHLLSKDKSFEYKLFYNGLRKAKLDHSFLKLSNITLKESIIPNKVLDLFLRFLKFPKLDRILGGVDIFFSPHFFVAPVSGGVKTISVFYDLSFIRFSEFFSFRKLFRHRLLYSGGQSRKADLIIAISESTKNDLINLYKIKPEKIKVIYPGIDKKFKPISENDSNLERVRKKYNLPANEGGLPNNFILYFGTIEPRKNILGLIKAFEQIKSASHLKEKIKWKGFEGEVKSSRKTDFDFSGLKLVIAGTKGWLYDDIFKKADSSEFREDIIFTDFIDEDDKVYLYNLAEIFVYPSFFEGFGLPPLEAMACGRPVIVSDKPALPEVVGDGAIMVDPNNINELVFSIRELLENKDLKNRLIKKAIERAKRFNWDSAANDFLETFKKWQT